MKHEGLVGKQIERDATIHTQNRKTLLRYEPQHTRHELKQVEAVDIKRETRGLVPGYKYLTYAHACAPWDVCTHTRSGGES